VDRLSEALVPRIGRYEVAGRLATGGMAEILLGRLVGPSGFERPVVIKRILPHLASDPTFVAMFLDEARIAARVRHPNVVQVYELLHEGEELAIVMEYLEGETLSGLMRRLVARGRRLEPALGMHIVAEAAAGLAAAHDLTDDSGVSLALVHRDVSPQNIFVGYDGSVKVLDFGIATVTDRSTRTETGQLKGKFEYMSPEQCLARPLDRRSDVFALGVVLYEVGTGYRLFKRPNQLLVLKAILEEPLPPPSQLDPSYPPELERICMKALARKRSERPATATELREALVVAARALDPTLVADAALGRLMRGLFADRMNEKTEMLRRLGSGSAITHIPNADVEPALELPAVRDDETIFPTGASGVVSQSAAGAAPSAGKRGPLLALGVGALALIAAAFAIVTISGADPESATPAGPSSAEPSVVRRAAPAPPSPSTETQRVTIEIESVPSGAEIWLDGSKRGATPFDLELGRSDQPVSIELRSAGHVTLVERVTPDKAQRLKLTLTRPSARAPTKPRTKPEPAPPTYHRVP
jgi:eukaryotic-like serine/threonine-protein kinase